MTMLALGLYAGEGIRAQTSSHFYALEFAENRGQWGDEFQYRAEIGVGAFFLHPDGFTVLRHDSADYVRALHQIHGHDHDDAKQALESAAGIAFSMRSHAYRVRFEGGNPSAAAGAERPIQTNISYFLGADPGKWRSGLSSYGVVTYRDVYPNTDVRYQSEAGNLKYDIIVRPGADLSRIRLTYDGVDGLSVRQGQLVVQTSTGITRELEPYAYQVRDGLKREVSCRYVVEGRTVRFEVKNYDPGVPLVIDHLPGWKCRHRYYALHADRQQPHLLDLCRR